MTTDRIEHAQELVSDLEEEDERHEQNMEQEEERHEQAVEDLKTRAGFDDILRQKKQVDDLKKQAGSTRTDTRTMFYEAINHLMPRKRITIDHKLTIREGKIYKYQKTSPISLRYLTRDVNNTDRRYVTDYRAKLLKAVREHAPDHVDNVRNALDAMQRFRDHNVETVGVHELDHPVKGKTHVLYSTKRRNRFAAVNQQTFDSLLRDDDGNIKHLRGVSTKNRYYINAENADDFRACILYKNALINAMEDAEDHVQNVYSERQDIKETVASNLKTAVVMTAL